jgi:RNA polymerase sigma-70 factor (ECF subfamily)
MDYNHVARLVEQYHAGDRHAFDKIYSLMYRRQYYFAFKMTGDQYASEDITQESFLKAYSSLDTLEDPKSFVRWLGRITYSSTIDYVRKHSRSVDSVEEMMDAPDNSGEAKISEAEQYTGSVEDEAIRDETRKNVREAVNSLDPEMKAIVILKYFNDYNDSEIAEIMHIPVGTVKSRLAGCRKKLSGKLQAFYSFSPFIWIMLFMKTEAIGTGLSSGAAAAVRKTIASKVAVPVLAVSVAAAPLVVLKSRAPEIRMISLNAEPQSAVASETVYVKAESFNTLKRVSIEETGQVLEKAGNIYRTQILENGVYTVAAEDAGGKVTRQAFTVNNIDTDIPEIGIPEKTAGKMCTVKVSDQGSGVDWNNTEFEDAGGNALKDTRINEDEGKISCSLAELPATVKVTDRAGNWRTQQVVYE